MPKVRQKRAANWSELETLALLAIWKDPEMRRNVIEVSINKKKVWGEMATMLHDEGYPERTPEQIHTKVKDLRALHRRLHDQLNVSGGGAAARRNPFWADLQDILGGRANVNPPKGSVGGSMEVSSSDDDNDDDNDNDEDNDDDADDHDGDDTVEDEDLLDDSGLGAHGENEEQLGADADADEVQAQGAADDDQPGPANPQGADADDGQAQGPADDDQPGPANPAAARPKAAVPKRQGKRQRETKKEQTVNALAKKMKEIQSSSDKKFLAAEAKRRDESRARQESHTTLVQGMLQAMERGYEERRRAEERRSAEMQAFMTGMFRFMAPGPHYPPQQYPPQQHLPPQQAPHHNNHQQVYPHHPQPQHQQHPQHPHHPQHPQHPQQPEHQHQQPQAQRPQPQPQPQQPHHPTLPNPGHHDPNYQPL